jgi:mycoredoxin
MKVIEVYGTEWCGDCKRAKKVLDERDVNYNWTDIDKEPKLMEYV